MRPISLLMVIIPVLLLFISLAHAIDVQKIIPIQGKLTNAAGIPISGTKSITFTIYDAQSGGNSLVSSTQTININQGYFTTTLDLNNLAFDRAYWLEITINDATPITLQPRQRLAPAPYAANLVTGTNTAVGNLVASSAIISDLIVTNPITSLTVNTLNIVNQMTNLNVNSLDATTANIGTLSVTNPIASLTVTALSVVNRMTRLNVDNLDATTATVQNLTVTGAMNAPDIGGIRYFEMNNDTIVSQVSLKTYYVATTVKGVCKRVNMTLLTELCADGDGCEFSIELPRMEGSSDDHFVHGIFFYNVSSKAWYLGGSTQIGGTDGDNSKTDEELTSRCYLTDGDSGNNCGTGDTEQGLSIYVPSGASSPYFCALTIRD